jgi:hypothetical protein
MNKGDNYYNLAKRFRVSSMRKIAKLLQFEIKIKIKIKVSRKMK